VEAKPFPFQIPHFLLKLGGDVRIKAWRGSDLSPKKTIGKFVVTSGAIDRQFHPCNDAIYVCVLLAIEISCPLSKTA
jgi:hypothetical protein